MSNSEASFWKNCDEYHSFVEKFENNIDITHPPTTKNYCSCKNVGVTYCKYASTEIKYYEYTGPRPQNIK